ncbi:MAG: NAD-dependent deacetylase [Candidatus Hodarchaeota archaeon]
MHEYQEVLETSESIMGENEKSSSFDSKIKSAVEIIKNSKYLICLTGAGISTESNIPDFRSPKTGLWNQEDAKILSKPGAIDEHLDFFWKVGFKIGRKILKAKPNKGHKILAKWEVERGLLKSTITQNVDGLHQRAGSKNVIEIHGTAHEARCMFCRGHYTLRNLVQEYKRKKRVPYCIVCAGPIKPSIVLFGESLPAAAIKEAWKEFENADVALVIGSSLMVYPANSLPYNLSKKGGKIIIINQMKTELDGIAEIVINDSISKTLGKMEKELG